mmetsp:Transcript_9036/g.11176  ORF Transcript_9036/g.11176 Transcript_9036/m.11176 type:complete len:187 (-) Transcript_9036:104-664(-)
MYCSYCNNQASPRCLNALCSVCCRTPGRPGRSCPLHNKCLRCRRNFASLSCEQQKCASCCNGTIENCSYHDNGCCTVCRRATSMRGLKQGICPECFSQMQPVIESEVKRLTLNPIIVIQRVRILPDNEIHEESANPPFKTCPICMDVEASTALIPCGHIYCRTCCTKFVICPTCRGYSTDSLRLYA